MQDPEKQARKSTAQQAQWVQGPHGQVNVGKASHRGVWAHGRAPHREAGQRTPTSLPDGRGNPHPRSPPTRGITRPPHGTPAQRNASVYDDIPEAWAPIPHDAPT